MNIISNDSTYCKTSSKLYVRTTGYPSPVCGQGLEPLRSFPLKDVVTYCNFWTNLIISYFTKFHKVQKMIPVYFLLKMGYNIYV